MKSGTLLLLLLLTGLTHGEDWKNRYDLPLNFNCPSGYSISSIASEHNNNYEDRVWDFKCQATNGQTAECSWTSYVNDFDQVIFFECPPQQVIAGMSSYHSNQYEDRRWKFYCCKSKISPSNCQWTWYVNSFDEYFHWTVPYNNALVGTQSYHQNREEDRRFRFKVCATS